MQVHYGEEVAIHIAPESCAGAREGVRRSVDRGTYRPTIEPRKYLIRMPTLSHWRKTIRAAARSCVVIEPGTYENSLRRNREISSLATCLHGVVRIGKARSRNR